MRIGLLFLTTGLMLGCSTFLASPTAPLPSKASYNAMNCDDLYLTFKRTHGRLIDLHQPKIATAEVKPESSLPIWQTMLNTSIENVQKLIDSDEEPNSEEIQNLTAETAVIEEVAVEKECTPLLASLTEHRVQIRQMKDTQ